MMTLALLLQTATAAGPALSPQARFEACVALVDSDPAAARSEAVRWRGAGGSFLARQCEGLADVAEQQWLAGAGAFEEAARSAELAHDNRAGKFWAQAGNAWLASGNAGKARQALDAALLSGNLSGLDLGEARLDHARALVADGDMEAARADLDLALGTAGDDPLAWLLSATLARRMNDLPRARKDIAEALKRSADDASVQLEAGNIAALARDEAAAREAWANAARLAPNSDVGRSAVQALRQFDGPAPASAAKP